MKLRRAFSLSISNFPLLICNAVYRIIVVLIAMFCVRLIMGSTISKFLGEESVVEFISTFKAWAKIGSNVSYVEELGTAFDSVLNTIHLNSSYSMCVFGMICVYLVCDLLLGICDFTIGAIINLHMSSMHHSRFIGAYIGNFSKAIISKLVCMAIYLVYDLVAMPLLYFLVLITSDFMGVLVISVGVLLYLFARSLITTEIEYMMPKIIIDNNSVWNALTNCVKEKGSTADFWSRLTVFFVIYVFTLSINVLMVITTFGVGLIITFPLSAVLSVSIRFVDYYSLIRRKYYVTFDNIVVPKELRENDENLLNSVEID